MERSHVLPPRVAVRRTRPPAAWARGLLPVLLGFLLQACSDREPTGAVGPNDEISVFTNLAPEDRALEAVRETYAYAVDAVKAEPAFYLDFSSWDKFDVHRHVKNQMFVIEMSRDDRLTRAVPGMMGREGRELMQAKRPFTHIVRDLHAMGQTTLFVVGWSSDDFLRLLAPDRAPRLQRELEESVVRGLTRTMYSLGEETALARELAGEFGWTLRLPKGFAGAEDPAGRVVKLHAQDPVRLLVIHWTEEEIPLDAGAWDPVMARILLKYNEGDYVMADRSRVEPVEFQGEPALRWEGIWQNDAYTIGGPFRALAFRRGGRSFLLVGIVYNPAGDKVPALRQVEAMFQSFRVVE